MENKFLKKTKELTLKSIKGGATVHDMFLSASEELGEVATALSVEKGYKKRKLSEDSKSESIDLTICALSVFFTQGGTLEDLEKIGMKKLKNGRNQLVNLTKTQKELITTLRSGKYIQGKHQLQRGNTFCCLGVACNIAEKNGIKVNYTVDGELYGRTLSTQPEVAKYFGLESDGSNLINDYATALYQLNDCGKSFNEIADILETVEGYFATN